ncbi:MAG: hypothetical protein ABIM44_05715 [candidate division WOR-3 bacterium]
MKIKVYGLKGLKFSKEDVEINLKVKGIKGEPIFAVVPKDLLTLLFESWEKLFLATFQPEYDFYTPDKPNTILYHSMNSYDFVLLRDFNFLINNNSNDTDAWYNPTGPLYFPFDLYIKIYWLQHIDSQITIRLIDDNTGQLIPNGEYIISNPSTFLDKTHYYIQRNFDWATYNNRTIRVEIIVKGWRETKSKSFKITPFMLFNYTSPGTSWPHLTHYFNISTGWGGESYTIYAKNQNGQIIYSVNSQSTSVQIAPFTSTSTDGNYVWSAPIYFYAKVVRNGKTYESPNYTPVQTATAQTHSYITLPKFTFDLTEIPTSVSPQPISPYPQWWSSATPVNIPASENDCPVNSNWTNPKTVSTTVSRPNVLCADTSITTHSITKSFTVYRKQFISKPLPENLKGYNKIVYQNKGFGVKSEWIDDQLVVKTIIFSLSYSGIDNEPLSPSFTIKYSQFTSSSSTDLLFILPSQLPFKISYSGGQYQHIFYILFDDGYLPMIYHSSDYAILPYFPSVIIDETDKMVFAGPCDFLTFNTSSNRWTIITEKKQFFVLYLNKSNNQAFIATHDLYYQQYLDGTWYDFILSGIKFPTSTSIHFLYSRVPSTLDDSRNPIAPPIASHPYPRPSVWTDDSSGGHYGLNWSWDPIFPFDKQSHPTILELLGTKIQSHQLFGYGHGQYIPHKLISGDPYQTERYKYIIHLHKDEMQIFTNEPQPQGWHWELASESSTYDPPSWSGTGGDETVEGEVKNLNAFFPVPYADTVTF